MPLRPHRRALVLAGLVSAATLAALVVPVSAGAEPTAPAVPATAAAADTGDAADGAAAAGGPLTGFAARSYGTSVTVGDLYTSGRSAPAGLGCTTAVGQQRENYLVSAQVPGLFSTAALRNTASTYAVPGGVAVTARSQIAGASLLGGLVSIGALTAQSTTTRANNGTVTRSDAGTSLGTISVAGVPVLNVRVNLRIELPGVGYFVIDEQTPTGRGGLEVNLIRLRVYAGNFDVIIGHATTNFGPDGGPLGGVAYSGAANVADVVRVGKIANVGLSCQGTDGRIVSNTVSTVSLPGLASAGVATNTAQGVQDRANDTASGRMTSTLAQVSLFNVLRVSAITADIQADYDAGDTSFVDRSTFANLTVFGRSLPLVIPANTTITIVPGVTLYLHRVLTSGDRTEVRMIELVVGGGANSLGLPPLLDLVIGSASVRAHSF